MLWHIVNLKIAQAIQHYLPPHAVRHYSLAHRKINIVSIAAMHTALPRWVNSYRSLRTENRSMSAVPRKRRKVRTYLDQRTAGHGSHLGQILDRAGNDFRESAGAFCCLSATPLAARAGNECRASLSPAPRVVPRKQLGGRSPARLILATDAGRIRSTVAAASCALRSRPVLHLYAALAEKERALISQHTMLPVQPMQVWPEGTPRAWRVVPYARTGNDTNK